MKSCLWWLSAILAPVSIGFAQQPAVIFAPEYQRGGQSQKKDTDESPQFAVYGRMVGIKVGRESARVTAVSIDSNGKPQFHCETLSEVSEKMKTAGSVSRTAERYTGNEK